MVLVLLFLDPLQLRGALLSYYPLLLGHEVPERLTLLLILSVGPQLIAQDLVSLKSAQLEHINQHHKPVDRPHTFQLSLISLVNDQFLHRPVLFVIFHLFCHFQAPFHHCLL